MKWRWFYAFLIALPPLFGVGAIAYFCFTEIPRLAKAEPRRIGMLYRAEAEALLAAPESAEYTGERKEGWRKRGKIAGSNWGYLIKDERCEIWAQNPIGGYLAKSCDKETPTNYILWASIIGGFSSLTLMTIAIVFVCLFLKYWRERDTFVSAVLHDLATPLVGLRNFIGYDDEEVRRQTERLVYLLNNLKAILLKESKRKKPETETFDMASAYREAYVIHDLDFKDLMGKAPELRAPQTAVVVKGDEAMTIQIIRNLLTNALKYAAPFGPVEAEIAEEGADGVFRLRDCGPGLKRGEMKKIFRRYYRSKSAREGSAGGFGIGLAGARSFARMMHGELSVEANTPNGLVFTLRLPSAKIQR